MSIIDDYLQAMETKPTQSTFSEIFERVILSHPSMAIEYKNFPAARLARSLLEDAKYLFNKLFSNLNFEDYLHQCMVNPATVYITYQSKIETHKTERFKILTTAVNAALQTYNPNCPSKIRERNFNETKFFLPNITINKYQQNLSTKNRTDSLQTLILQIVKTNPHITCSKLLEELKKDTYKEQWIEEITEEQIYFIKDGKGGNSAPISGLKDRLSRAKKIFKSR